MCVLWVFFSFAFCFFFSAFFVTYQHPNCLQSELLPCSTQLKSIFLETRRKYFYRVCKAYYGCVCVTPFNSQQPLAVVVIPASHTVEGYIKLVNGGGGISQLIMCILYIDD